MLKKGEFWLIAVVAVTGFVLVLVNIGLVLSNRDRQASINTRAQYVQQSVQLQGLYQEIIKALADLAVRNKDDQLRELLSRNGMTISVTPSGGTAASPAAPARGKP
jgi:hypothetical protein